MPIYEYRCSNCGHELEALQKLADAPLVVCPSCDKETLIKLVSASAFQLKGSGWYATDFKGGAKPPAKPGDAAKPAGDGASESKTESKSESKAEAKSEAASDAKTDAKPEVKTAKKTESAAPSGGSGGAAP